MAEYVGTENQIGVQSRLRERQPWIAETPGTANGGRVLHFVEPDAVGWDKVIKLANEDKLAGFPCVRKAETIVAIHAHLGSHWKTPIWDAFLGSPDQVLSACQNQIEGVTLPKNWRIDLLENPDEKQIGKIQTLNAETGVSPYPAYYSRGEAVPILTVCISDSDDNLIATASATFRYHSKSRLAGTVFGGMVSVAATHRRRGLGRLVNATMLVESYDCFKWTTAKEQAAPDNAASQAMIKACGLDNSDGYVSIGAINSEEAFTR